MEDCLARSNLQEDWSQGNNCFCCFSEENVFLCGCSCTTMYVCAGCMWKMTSQQLSARYWETLGRQCTVCRNVFSDAAVLAGCEHARKAVAVESCGTPARDNVENDVLYMLVALTDYDAVIKMARDVLHDYETALGAQHLCTVRCEQNVAYILASFGDDQEAVVKFGRCAEAQGAMVQNWNWLACSDVDRKWMYRYYCSRLNIVLCCKNIKGTDKDYDTREFNDALYSELNTLVGVFEMLHTHSSTHPESMASAHDDFAFVSLALADIVTERVLTGLHGFRARTRQQHSLVLFARASRSGSSCC